MAGEQYAQGSERGFNVAPAGGHTSGAPDVRPRARDIVYGFFHWTRKRLPDPGAQNYAYESLGLAQFTPIGPSVRPSNSFAVMQPPQPYVRGRAVPTSGVGGLSAGQIIYQPLINPLTP